MTWHDHIHADPKVAARKPVVRDTRLAVDFLLELFAKGWVYAARRAARREAPQCRNFARRCRKFALTSQ